MDDDEEDAVRLAFRPPRPGERLRLRERLRAAAETAARLVPPAPFEEDVALGREGDPGEPPPPFHELAGRRRIDRWAFEEPWCDEDRWLRWHDGLDRAEDEPYVYVQGDVVHVGLPYGGEILLYESHADVELVDDQASELDPHLLDAFAAATGWVLWDAARGRPLVEAPQEPEPAPPPRVRLLALVERLGLANVRWSDELADEVERVPDGFALADLLLADPRVDELYADDAELAILVESW